MNPGEEVPAAAPAAASGADVAGPALALSACMRCRKHKLKCSREKPICSRCNRLRTECYYPAPPDRKKLAARRAEEQRRSYTIPSDRSLPIAVPNRTRTYGSTPTLPSHPNAQRAGSIQPPRPMGSSPQIASSWQAPSPVRIVLPSLEPNRPIGLSREVALFLIEIYFERHYQAHLLFNKHEFIANYLDDKVADFVSLAVLAFASLFLDRTPCSGNTALVDVGIADISKVDWLRIGEEWAEYSSQKALMHVDKPCLENVQACQILGMFWFARSQTARTNIHVVIAYRTSRLLRLDEVKGRQGLASHSAAKELGLRCFWAGWLTKCASQRNAHFEGDDCWRDIVDRPLPTDDEQWDPESPRHCLDSSGMLEDLTSHGQQSLLGLHECLVVAFGIWWEVQNFVQSTRHNGPEPAIWMSKVFILDRKLEKFRFVMPEEIRFPHCQPLGGTPSSTPSTDLSRAFCLEYVYHMCVCYLHSSVVPVLSGNTNYLDVSRKSMRVSAEQVLQHSSIMTEMTSQFLSKKLDISKLWPIVGYGAYLCTTVQLRCVFALNSSDISHLERTRVHLSLVDQLKDYWSTLRDMGYSMQQQFAHALSSVASPGTWNSMASRDTRSHPTQSRGDEIDNLINKDAAHTSPSSTRDIYTYVRDEDKPGENNSPAQTAHTHTTHTDQSSPHAPLTATAVVGSQTAYRNSEATFQTGGMGMSSAADESMDAMDDVTQLYNCNLVDRLLLAAEPIGGNSRWDQNQNPEMVASMPGNEYYLLDSMGYRIDMY